MMTTGENEIISLIHEANTQAPIATPGASVNGRWHISEAITRARGGEDMAANVGRGWRETAARPVFDGGSLRWMAAAVTGADGGDGAGRGVYFLDYFDTMSVTKTL